MYLKNVVFAVTFVTYLSVCCYIEYVEGGCESFRPMRNNDTLSYLEFEKGLWSKLSNSATQDKESLITLVRAEHKQFLTNLGFLSLPTSHYDKYKLPPMKKLSATFSKTWDFRNNARKKFLDPEEFQQNDFADAFEHEILNASLNLSKEINDEINRPDFWKDATNYLEFCKNRKYESDRTLMEAPYQIIYDYYREGRNALLHAYVFIQFAFLIKAIKGREPGMNTYQPTVSLLAMDEFKDRLKIFHESASTELESASRDAWNCQRNSKEGLFLGYGRFVTMHNFIKGFIDNEINFSKDKTCSKTCSDYTKAENLNCENGTMCSGVNIYDLNGIKESQTICDGVIHDCTEIDSDGDIVVSYFHGPKYGPRYETIQFNDRNEKQIYGEVNSGNYMINLTASTWYQSSDKCSNCYCLCDSRTNSERYFSLSDVVSHIEYNKVVTGARIIKEYDIFQWEISEYRLKPGAQVETLFASESIIKSYQSKEDCFAMSYENRTINLDDVIVPAGKVVTGVRFAHRDGHVLIEVRATDFDYAEGQLKNLENSIWISNEEGGQHEIKLPNRLNPYEYSDANQGTLYVPQDIPKNSYIQFVPADFKNSLGQFMVPLIESPLAPFFQSNCPTALSGIGLTYANDNELNRGGVILPKLIVYQWPIEDLLLK